MRFSPAVAAVLVFGLMTAGAPHAAPSDPKGYLGASQLPDAVRLLGPPPTAGSGAVAGDLATFKATRALQDSPRWSLATRDAAELAPANLMADFSCAVGVALNPHDAPALFRLFARADVDADAIGQPVKKLYRRPRPFIDNGGPICVAEADWLKKSFSYPSGHSTTGWTLGLILADLAPDRAGEILARARSFGESRAVCGVHYASDVQAGRLAGSAVFSALQNSPAYREDLRLARRELAQLRAASASPRPDAAECAVEAEASAQPIW